MNDTPCPLCNNLYNRAAQAFIKRETAEYSRLMDELQAHREKCPVIKSEWYLFLWPNAVVVEAAR